MPETRVIRASEGVSKGLLVNQNVLSLLVFCFNTKTDFICIGDR